MKKMGTKLLKAARKQLRAPTTQAMICMGLRNYVKPELVLSLLQQSPLPIDDARVQQISDYLTSASPETINKWVDWGETLAAAAKTLRDIGAFVMRALPILGLYMVWVWIRSCFGDIAVKAVKAKALER
ncbi:hypothetical protein JKP88DRAFT_226535 [Tribonema minus]|uniref:Uncharacterized protein n=1 Tax=Tribonema minus TaxID=303371 RepID=A0A835YLK8_9STRA|nr:hypothetical protein JKP88DRAFT_226535 [Tribonema minus]